MAKIIKCPNCGIYNDDVDYCISCGALLSYEKRRALEAINEEKEREERKKLQSEQSLLQFEKYKNHKSPIVRALAKITKTIWLVFIAIGIGLAWIIAAIAA